MDISEKELMQIFQEHTCMMHKLEQIYASTVLVTMLAI